MGKIQIVSSEDIEKLLSTPLPTAAKDEEQIFSPEDTEILLKKLDRPVDFQKDMAVRIKAFLDKKMAKEMRDKGELSDYTLRWVKVYNDLLVDIDKSINGQKKVNLHLVKVTHAHIASQVRKAEKDDSLE